MPTPLHEYICHDCISVCVYVCVYLHLSPVGMLELLTPWSNTVVVLCCFSPSLCECLFSTVSFSWGSVWVGFESPQLTAITLERKRVMKGVDFRSGISSLYGHQEKEFSLIYSEELCGMFCAASGMQWARLRNPTGITKNQVPPSTSCQVSLVRPNPCSMGSCYPFKTN